MREFSLRSALRSLARRRPSAAMVVAMVALVLAGSSAAIATTRLVNGDTLIARGSLSGDRIRSHTITGRQINLSKIGTVPRALTASFATSATTATDAQHARTADSATAATKAQYATSATNALYASSASTATSAGQANIALRAVEATSLTPPSLNAIPLESGWEIYAYDATPSYSSIGRNYIRLTGAAARTTGTSDIIGQLPTGYKPVAGLVVPVVTGNRTLGILSIGSDGTLTLLSGDPSMVSLDGITFIGSFSDTLAGQRRAR